MYDIMVSFYHKEYQDIMKFHNLIPKQKHHPPQKKKKLPKVQLFTFCWGVSIL